MGANFTETGREDAKGAGEDVSVGKGWGGGDEVLLVGSEA